MPVHFARTSKGLAGRQLEIQRLVPPSSFEAGDVVLKTFLRNKPPKVPCWEVSNPEKRAGQTLAVGGALGNAEASLYSVRQRAQTPTNPKPKKTREYHAQNHSTQASQTSQKFPSGGRNCLHAKIPILHKDKRDAQTHLVCKGSRNIDIHHVG